jgi:hypothetical protein
MILRFRDLSTAPGDTLRLHASMIAERGYVWWGWWAKSGERVPITQFGELRKWARKDDGLTVWLFDSGREQLHRAKLVDIRWDLGLDPMEAPENGAATPEYYNRGGAAAYPAWFKLAEITEDKEADPAAVLHTLAYVQVDEFFQQASSQFVSFYGKQVSSVEELREQNRSIWFTRALEPDDPRHQIRLLDPRTLSPAHFPNEFHQAGSLNLLWLSDVHFSVDQHHAFPLEPTVDGAPLGDRIEKACGEVGIKDVGGLILSGDLSWKSAPAEFDQAHGLIKRLQTWSRLQNYQIAVCPGNHDLAFSTTPWENGSEVAKAPNEATIAYSNFYSNLFYLKPNEWLSCGRKLLLGNAVPVEIISLNSSLLWQKEGLFQGQGFVGQGQLDHAAMQMGWTRPGGEPIALRVVVIHHHLLPVIYRETPVAGRSYSTVLDAEAVVRWLIRHGVKVVLHGHMHTPFHTVIERPESFGKGESHRLHVFGLGSSGVETQHVGEPRTNMFGVLQLSRDCLRVRYFSVHPTNPSVELATISVQL